MGGVTGHALAAAAIGLAACAQILLVGLLHRVAHRVHREREKQAALEARRREEFLAGVSHALRTPLTCVVGFGQLLEQEYGSELPSEAGEMVAELNQQAAEMSALVDNLLIRAQDAGGSLYLASERTNLRLVAAEVIRNFAWLYPNKTIRLHGDFEVLATADERRAHQVVRNLVSNAVRHGGDRIGVEVRGEAARATLTVRDNGPGLPDGKSDLDLRPFESCDPNTPSPSLGLGLPVSLRLTQLMGGTLTYGREDGESSFTLTLGIGSMPVDNSPTPTRRPAPNETQFSRQLA